MSARACNVAPFLTTLACAAALAACDLENPGQQPPAGTLYFPNALAISNEAEGVPRYLFVASTNFDLRFTTGALHAFSLDAIDEAIGECGDELGADSCFVDLGRVLADEVFIPTYTTAIAIDPDGERLVVTSRTQDALTVVDVDLDAEDIATTDPDASAGDRIASSVLSCGDARGRDCAATSTTRQDFVSLAPIAQPEAPSDVIVGRLSSLTGDPADDRRDYVATAHQRGAVALYLDTVDEETGRESLQLSAAIEGLGRAPTGIAFDPASGYFHVALGASGLLRVGATVDRASERGVFLYETASVLITGGSFGGFRTVAFLDQPVGLGLAASESQALIIANQPSALVLANVTPGAGSSTTGRVQRAAEIGAGGARLAIGSIGGRPLAAVSCLDGRSIYIVDLTSMETRAVVPNLSGPYGVAFDEARQRLYATDFRSSVVRIVDLSRLASPDAAPESVRVIATLGRPRQVQELR